MAINCSYAIDVSIFVISRGLLTKYLSPLNHLHFAQLTTHPQ